MHLRGKFAALYGRFSAGARERFASEIVRAGGGVARDLTRRSDLLVVGALASPLIDSGHLGARLATAASREAPVFSERRFAEMLRGEETEAPSLPIATMLLQTGLSREEAAALSAFDIIRIEGDRCRFRDGEALKAASELLRGGRSLGEAVRILTKVRDSAPRGRRKIVLDPRGQAALQWEQGLTTLEGQGWLPLEEAAASIEDLFEAAAVAEADGDGEEAARLYSMGARIDKTDPIACFNLGNVKLAAETFAEAALAFRQAIARDPAFVEARYNLAQAYEGADKLDLAREELEIALKIEPDYADARFNLAQLELKSGALAQAKLHYERYLAGDPPAEWAAKARRAIQYCAAVLSAQRA